MQLVAILLITVSVLTIMSGLAVFIGASKGNRAKSAWFFAATIFAMIWTLAIVFFLRAPLDIGEEIHIHVKATYISAIFIDIALLGYISWNEKFGKFLTIAFLICGVFLSGVFLSNPELLYTDVVLSNSGNGLVTNIGPFYFVYIAFFGVLVPAVIFTLIKQIIKLKSKRQRAGKIVLLVGFAISGLSSLIFNLILPLTRWDLIWVGPFAIGATIIGFYYSILRYRILNLSSMWLKILSYIVIMASAAVIYMIIFFIIFAILFKGSTPSTEVIMLNFVMIAIVLLLFPVTNELTMFIKSLISDQRVDMVYIIKKLSNIVPQGVNLKELASFLADHMHFEYIGFLLNGQVYGSANRDFSTDGIKMIDGLGEPENGVWQVFNEKTELWQELDLSAVAALRDANGETFGQVIVGKPLGKKNNFSRRDLVQVETVINLVSVIIDSKIHKRN